MSTGPHIFSFCYLSLLCHIYWPPLPKIRLFMRKMVGLKKGVLDPRPLKEIKVFSIHCNNFKHNSEPVRSTGEKREAVLPPRGLCCLTLLFSSRRQKCTSSPAVWWPFMVTVNHRGRSLGTGRAPGVTHRQPGTASSGRAGTVFLFLHGAPSQCPVPGLGQEKILSEYSIKEWRGEGSLHLCGNVKWNGEDIKKGLLGTVAFKRNLDG